MALAFAETTSLSHNPLDAAEDVLDGRGLPFARQNDDELAVEIEGRWCNYHLYFTWRADVGALHFSCALDMKVPSEQRGPVSELLALVNEKMWLGHFDVWADEGLPMFRHTVLLRGVSGASREQLEDLVNAALLESERFYPALQFVVWGGRSPVDALDAALFETEGEA